MSPNRPSLVYIDAMLSVILPEGVKIVLNLVGGHGRSRGGRGTCEGHSSHRMGASRPTVLSYCLRKEIRQGDQGEVDGHRLCKLCPLSSLVYSVSSHSLSTDEK